MDVAATQLINQIVQQAAEPAHTQALVGAAMTRQALDIQQQLAAGLLAALPAPTPNPMQPHLGVAVDFYA
jgi:hypothetical protein